VVWGHTAGYIPLQTSASAADPTSCMHACVCLQSCFQGRGCQECTSSRHPWLHCPVVRSSEPSYMGCPRPGCIRGHTNTHPQQADDQLRDRSWVIVVECSSTPCEQCGCKGCTIHVCVCFFKAPSPYAIAAAALCCRYALNVWFNLLNKSIFKYFPFPYTVSTVHVIVGTAYCALVYVLGLKSWSFGRVSLSEQPCHNSPGQQVNWCIAWGSSRTHTTAASCVRDSLHTFHCAIPQDTLLLCRWLRPACTPSCNAVPSG